MSQATDILSPVHPFHVGSPASSIPPATVVTPAVLPRSIEVLPPSSTVSNKTKSLILQKLLPDKHGSNPTVILSEVSSFLAQHNDIGETAHGMVIKSNHPLEGVHSVNRSNPIILSQSPTQENQSQTSKITNGNQDKKSLSVSHMDIGATFVESNEPPSSIAMTESSKIGTIATDVFDRMLQVLPETRSEVTPEKILVSTSESFPHDTTNSSLNVLKIVYECEDCEYSSHNKHYLKQHIDLVHNAERPFKCPFCDYAGKRGHSLREHLIVHSNERPFACSHCNATFRRKGHLTNHTKLHTSSSQKTAGTPSCPICSKSFNLSELESHVKLVHNISRLYACEFCEFLAVDQSSVVEHMDSHSHQQVYVCSACDFQTSSYSVFVAHAESHIDDIGEEDEEKSVGTESPSKASTQPVLMKCTECGFTSSESQAMKNHMWQHINKETEDGTGDEQKPPDKEASHKTNVPGTNDSMYRCGECSFQCHQASVFVSHIFSHQPFFKTETPTVKDSLPPSYTPLYKVQQVEDKDGQPEPQSIPYKVMPLTKENTCYNQDMVGFVHDKATARFRCTICGYTCEYQRTIKAHVWKHSGHKDIDYPMFQNGPLSIYDESQVSVVNTEPNTIKSDTNTVADVKTTPPMNTISPIAPALASKLAAKAVARLKQTTQLAVIDKNDELISHEKNEKIVSKDARIVGVRSEGASSALMHTIDVTMETAKVCVQQTKELEDAQTPALTINVNKAVDLNSKDVSKPIHVPVCLPVSSVVGKGEMAVSEPKVCYLPIPEIVTNHPAANKIINICIMPETPTKGITGMKRRASLDDLATIRKQPCRDMQKGGNVVVETVDSISTISGFTGMHSQQNSPRIIEVSTSPKSPKSILPEKIDDSGKTLSEKEYPNTTDKVPQRRVNPEQVVPDLDEVPEREQKTLDSELDAQLVVPEKQAEVDSESATILLSLLKKGPNFNPACPPTEDKNLHCQQEDVPRFEELVKKDTDGDSEDKDFSRTEDSDGSTHSGKPKAGISSSLLAVIEQLREKSRLDDIIDLSALGAPAAKKPKRKTRKDSSEEASVSSLDDIENVEVIEELDGNRYRCRLCHYANSGIVLIRQHMRLHKTKMPFECSLCDFVAISSENLQDHMIQHCKVRTYQCKLCPSAFNYKSQLRAHMRAHKEKNPFLCDFCDFETINTIVFHNHLRSHSEKKQYICEACKEGFGTKYALRIHKRETCPKQRSLCCDECDFEATGTQELKNHSRTHKQFRCSKCDLSTSSIAHFRDHVHMHEQTKLLKCDMCDFTAVSNRSLKSHMKRHINDQRFVQQPLEQYKCNLCGYVCHHLPSLKSHMWRHVSNQNYSYEFTNEVINAAIDYDSRLDPQDNYQADIVEFNQTITKKLKEKMGLESLAEAAKLLQVPSAASVCWVTFRCCQCGFETINKAELSAHMKSHSDVIHWTLEVPHNYSQQPDDSDTESTRESVGAVH